jgi:hypothetical protein
LKKSTFAAPIVLTFPAVASFARAGSGPKKDTKDKKDKSAGD